VQEGLQQALPRELLMVVVVVQRQQQVVQVQVLAGVQLEA